ncbi:MAG: hypothetical protein LAQ69_32435 [Acidobacteriia bacterium]|nr:hypothetical protein [Terriglobia bacterium]
MPDTGQSVGPYQLQGQLGAGGMGEVYRALDTRVGRQVAFKILPESLAGNEGGGGDSNRKPGWPPR